MENIDEHRRQRQLYRDDKEVEVHDALGVAPRPLHGDVDVVEELDDQPDQLHGKVPRADGDQLIRRAGEPQKAVGEREDRQQHRKPHREADDVQTAHALAHEREVALAVGAADLDARAHGKPPAHGGEHQVELREIRHRRNGLLADMGRHHGVQHHKEHVESLVQRQGRTDVQNDPQHRAVQAPLQKTLVPAGQFRLDLRHIVASPLFPSYEQAYNKTADISMHFSVIFLASAE